MLHVKNQTRGTTLVDAGHVADSFWKRFKGLIGTKNLPRGNGLLIEPCNSIHMMFMSIPIDVAYVDKDDHVVALDPEMKPWRLGKPHRTSRYVIELPAGTLARTHTQVGDALVVKGR